MEQFSRRDAMAGMTAAGVLFSAPAFAANPVIPEATIAARKHAPVIPKKVNQLYNLKPTVDQPNDMQFAPNGELWILDQKDPTDVMSIDDGSGKFLANILR